MGDLLKDFGSTILALVPQYVSDLLAIYARPKTFLVSVVDTDNALRNSFIFLGLSLLSTELLQLPFENIAYTWVSAQIVYLGFLVILSTLVVKMSWAMVGGKISLPATLLLINYITAAGTILTTVIGLPFISFGIKTVIPVTQKLQKSGFNWIGLTDDERLSMIEAALIVILTYVVSELWSFITWGAFRRINKLSRLKSGVAFLLAEIVSLPLTLVGATGMPSPWR